MGVDRSDRFRSYRVAEGKGLETWAMQDRLGLMEQLGPGRRGAGGQDKRDV